MIFTREMKRFFRTMVCEFCNVKQVGYQFTHHLSGVVPAVIRKGKSFIVIEKLLTHIPLHIGTHHVSLVAYVIFAQTLQDVHEKQSGGDPRKSGENLAAPMGKQRIGHGAQDLRISQIYDADKSCAYKVNKKDRLIRRIIVYEFSDCVHDVTPSFQLNY